MLPIIRSRWDARRLARELRQSLATPEDEWKLGTDDESNPTLTNNGFKIVLVPRAVRLLDAIHVYRENAEIWLPLLARLRLRGAARWRLIHDASEHLHDVKARKTRARRRSKKSAA